jgi:hypothetical protein
MGLLVVKIGRNTIDIKAEPRREYRLVGAGAGLSWNLSLAG